LYKIEQKKIEIGLDASFYYLYVIKYNKETDKKYKRCKYENKVDN